MLEPMVDLAAEALRQAGLLGNCRVMATERMTAGKASAVYKVLLSAGRAVVLKLAPVRVVQTEALLIRAGIMFNSFWRRRETDYGRRLPSMFARLREHFTKEGVGP